MPGKCRVSEHKTLRPVEQAGGVVVFGQHAFNDPADLKTWNGETGLASDLLYDSDRSVAMAYGAAEAADQEKPARLSVLVGPDGVVRNVYASPDPDTHPAEALADIG